MTLATSRPAPPPATKAPRPRLGRVSPDKPAGARLVINAVEGFGKTTIGAYAPNPAILMARGETGYTTLREHKRVPDADCVELTAWKDVLDQVDDLINSDGKYGSVVLDALGGFERLCHEFICNRDFQNDWGDKGFGSYQRGYDVSISEWLSLLARLERLRTTRGIPIILLSHCKVKPFKNPLGPDYDRYTADCHDKTWSVTHKWADAVFFGTYVTVTEEKKKGRVKGIGGDDRVLFATRRDGFDAKNRYGIAGQIDMPNEPAAMWDTLWGAINGQKQDEIPM